MSNTGWSRTAFISYFNEKGFYFSHCQQQQQQQRWFNPLHRWPVVIAWLKATLISVVMTKRIGFEERPLRRMNCYSQESNTKPQYMCYHSEGDRHSLDFDFWETARANPHREISIEYTFKSQHTLFDSSPNPDTKGILFSYYSLWWMFL